MEIHCKDIKVIQSAFRRVREDYSLNPIWKRPPEWMRTDRQGRNVFRCTLKVHSSRGPGARLSHTGRRIPAACWHVFGDFFDYIWEADPGAMILSAGLKMEGPADNWQDKNIGSMMRPMPYSQACNCER